MKIELSAPKQVKITWPAYDAAIEAQIVDRLKTVPGIEGRGRRWYAPAIQTARLMELFPKASFDYDALRIADATARTFCNSMAQMGIELQIIESGAIVAFGEGVSPLIQQLVDERAHALKSLVVEAMLNPRPCRQTPQGAWQGPLSAETARLEPLIKGIENAKRKAEEQPVRYPKRRPRRKAKATK